MKTFDILLTREEVEALARLIEKEVTWSLPPKLDPDAVRTRVLLFSVLNKLPSKEVLDERKTDDQQQI